MELSDLNNQLLALQNEFQLTSNSQQSQQQIQQQSQQQSQSQFPNQQDVNFQDSKKTIDTTQIKRPTKSGEHRNDINEKMAQLNTNYFHSENTNTNSPDMLNNQSIKNNTMNNFQSSRNNSNYINNNNNSNNTNHTNNLQTIQSRSPQIEPTNQNNHLSSYYNNNFETLQTQNNINKNLQYSSLNDINHGQTNNQTHNNGMSMLNVRNMYTMNDNNNTQNDQNMTNKINDTGFHRKDEKKIDYRQNMNTKLDDMIFDNPNALPLNPILQNSNDNNNNNMKKDTRMIIQDSNKDFYRQSSNNRMSHYSPLSKAAHLPIHMANMSVNDFYSGMNPDTDFKKEQKSINQEHNKLNSKEMLNDRMNNYSPLAKTIQYEKKQPKQSNQPQQNNQSNQPSQNMRQWNSNDINGNLKNVVYNQLPVQSNSERM